MDLNHQELIYEGKAKQIYTAHEPNKVLIKFKNDATAFNALKKSQLEGKGYMNCQISAYLFELLESKGIKTHYLGLAGDTLMYASKVKVIPLEVVLRNIAFGSLCKQSPIPIGTSIRPPLLDLYYKDDSLQDPLLTDARLKLLDLINPSERSKIEKIIRNVNEILCSFFDGLYLQLVDFKLELGVDSAGDLVVADEISPDNCRIWDKKIDDCHDRILDKDRFRKDLGSVVESYEEILKRIQSVSPKPRSYK